MNEKTIRLADLINQAEAEKLTLYVASRKKDQSIHQSVMEWLDKNPQGLKRFENHGVLPEYGAYLMEFYLQLK